MSIPEPIHRRLTEAHAEALRVGDSPLRADALAEKLVRLSAEVEAAEMPEELRARIGSALAEAERVLRRDDDGRDAARRLQGALRLGGGAPRRPSPFLDD
jgi:hypothetical protein